MPKAKMRPKQTTMLSPNKRAARTRMLVDYIEDGGAIVSPTGEIYDTLRNCPDELISAPENFKRLYEEDETNAT